MARRKRQPKEQSDHDWQVKRTADWYRVRGYGVMADLEGYLQPPEMNGHRPDIVVTRNGKPVKVIEVETRSTLDTDAGQHQALRRGAKAKGAKFERKLAQARQPGKARKKK